MIVLVDLMEKGINTVANIIQSVIDTLRRQSDTEQSQYSQMIQREYNQLTSEYLNDDISLTAYEQRLEELDLERIE
jgi:hypothetical protein